MVKFLSGSTCENLGVTKMRLLAIVVGIYLLSATGAAFASVVISMESEEVNMLYWACTWVCGTFGGVWGYMWRSRNEGIYDKRVAEGLVDRSSWLSYIRTSSEPPILLAHLVSGFCGGGFIAGLITLQLTGGNLPWSCFAAMATAAVAEELLIIIRDFLRQKVRSALGLEDREP